MKRLATLLIISAFILQSAGCGLFYSIDQNLPQKIDIWVENHEYAKAMDALAYVNKSHLQYELLQRKKVEVQQAAKKYEAQQLKRIQTQVKQQNWHDAEQLFNQSLQKLPHSELLQSAHQEFVKKRAFHLKSLYYQLQINKAEWLVKNADVQKEISRIQPEDRTSTRALAEHKKESKQVYQELSACGSEAMKFGDLELAEQCFLLADELQPSKALQSTIIDIQRQLASQQKRTSLVFSERGKALLNKAKRKMQDGNLKQAIDLYKQIPSKDKKYVLVITFKRDLDKRVKQNVSQGIELGRKLYSQGEVKQALAIWYDVRNLDPKNEYLISHIERAQRVLEKLDQLQKEGTTIKPPEPKDSNG